YQGLPARAFSVPIESERRLYFFVLTRFLQREPVSTSLENALVDSGEKIGKIVDLLCCHRLQDFRHGAVIAVAAVVLVFPHGLGEIILALIGDARDVVLAGKIGVVAGIAAGLLPRRRG